MSRQRKEELTANGILIYQESGAKAPLVEERYQCGELVQCIDVSHRSAPNAPSLPAYRSLPHGIETLRLPTDQIREFSAPQESDNDWDASPTPLSAEQYIQQSYKRYLDQEIAHNIVWFGNEAALHLVNSPSTLAAYMSCSRNLVTILTSTQHSFLLVVQGQSVLLCLHDSGLLGSRNEKLESLIELRPTTFYLREFNTGVALMMLFDMLLEELSEEQSAEEIIRLARRETFVAGKIAQARQEAGFAHYYRVVLNQGSRIESQRELCVSTLPPEVYCFPASEAPR